MNLNLKQNFQNQMAEELFPGNLTEDKACFIRRFAPENHPNNRESTHIKIAELMKKDLGAYCENKIGQTIRNVIEVIDQKYGEEMKADDVNTEVLLNLKPGGKKDKESDKKISPWQEVYKWLWERKFLRWLDKNGWQILQEKAISAPDWIQFKSQQEMASSKRAPKRPPASVQKVASKIPAYEALWMVVDLAYSNYQLLLFNRSGEGQYLLCPSLEFAPNGMIDKSPILLPQQGSYADDYDEKENFTFEVIGQEEFLAIVLEKPLKLDWLTPREEDSLPECNDKRFKELFDELEQQENWQVFYQSFEVVEKQ
jgi:hypothetical protein